MGNMPNILSLKRYFEVILELIRVSGDFNGNSNKVQQNTVFLLFSTHC